MPSAQLDKEICIRAYKARDALFFIGVKTTGIFCRPICPAPSPQTQNVDLFASAAAAAASGLRPCLRCRPESSPGTPAWDGSAATVARALRLINEGALDDGDVEKLSSKFSITSRQLSRLFQKHLGASPVAVAQTRRLLFAKKLLDESAMSMADIAFASGFGSIRRFNTVFSKTYGRAPSSLRKKKLPVDIVLTLPYRPPFDWQRMLAFFGHRAINGIEKIIDGSYYRSLNVGGDSQIIAVRQAKSGNTLELRLVEGDTRQLMKLAERCRRVFDLSADITSIHEHLNKDALLNAIITKSPGLRLPGTWDVFETMMRAILGQQVSVVAATTLTGRLVERCGTENGSFPDGSPAFSFPTAEQVANADLSNMGITGKREATIKRVAGAIAARDILLEQLVTVEQMSQALEAMPGIGPWTSQYIAMRGLSEPDAFPASDLGLLKATGMNEKELINTAERWRPWRAYAAIHLWHSLN